MKLIFSKPEIDDEEADADQYDEADTPLRTPYPERDNVAPVTEGTYPTEYNCDKLMFQASLAFQPASLAFQPTAEEVVNTANLLGGVVKEQLLAMVFNEPVWFKQVVKAITADFPAIKPGMLLYHGTSKAGAESIRKTGVDMSKSHKGYFGQGFYTAVDEDLAKSNYADFSGDEEGGVVLTFKLKPGFRVLDLRNEDDYEFWTASGLDKKISSDGFAHMAVKKGVDGLFDRSFEGVVIYNPKALELVAKAIHATDYGLWCENENAIFAPDEDQYFPIENVYLPLKKHNPVYEGTIEDYMSGEKPAVTGWTSESLPNKDRWRKLSPAKPNKKYPFLMVDDGVHRSSAAFKNGEKWVRATRQADSSKRLTGGVPV